MSNNFFIRNFILGLFVSVGLFIGLNCFCNASTVKSINLKHGSNFPQDTNYQTSITFSSSPSFSIQTYIDSYAPNTSHNYPYYCNLHVTTSNGDYIIKSSKGTFTANDNSTVTNNLGLGSAGTYTLPGYFINSYLEYSCGYLDDGYGNIYLQSTGSTVNPAYTGTYNTMNYLSNFDINSVNSNYVSFSNSVISSDNGYNVTSFVSGTYYAHYSAIDTYYNQYQNSVYRSGSVITADHIINNGGVTFDYITLNLHAVLMNGNDVIISTYNADYNTFNSLTSSSVVFNLSSNAVTLSSCPTAFYYEYILYGAKEPFLTFTNPLNSGIYFTRIATVEETNWNTIAESDELSELGDTSTSIEDTLNDNNTFEEEAFTSLDDKLDDYNFDSWSVLPGQGGMYFATDLINKYYNLLPFKVQWLITTVISFGLISMLLTVGTRVIQRTGEFTRARPIRVSEKHIYHHKSK